MNPNVVTVKPETNVVDVIGFIMKYNVNGFPVVTENGELVGIISKSDLFSKQTGQPYKEKRVSDLMTKDVISVASDVTIKEVLDIMAVKSVNHIPVVENGKVIGIITRDDVIAYCLEQEGEKTDAS
jgi:CBS domain-containing protein